MFLSVCEIFILFGLIYYGFLGFKASVKFLYSGFRYTYSWAALVVCMGLAFFLSGEALAEASFLGVGDLLGLADETRDVFDSMVPPVVKRPSPRLFLEYSLRDCCSSCCLSLFSTLVRSIIWFYSSCCSSRGVLERLDAPKLLLNWSIPAISCPYSSSWPVLFTILMVAT